MIYPRVWHDQSEFSQSRQCLAQCLVTIGQKNLFLLTLLKCKSVYDIQCHEQTFQYYSFKYYPNRIEIFYND